MEKKPSPFAPREMAVMWQHRSAEKRACYHQAYHLAALALDHALEDSDSDRPKAVILDLDETVLDNSPFFARLLAPGTTITESQVMHEFIEWLEGGEQTVQPGAAEFLNYAKSRGVEPYYVSNRPEAMRDVTIRILKAEGCPNADPEHVLLKKGKLNFFGHKHELWDRVAADHDVLLYVGDNLDDMGGAFDDRGDDSGHDVVDRNAAAFGTRYILMPNPMYGPWERNL
ncbi:MAG: 5'-nucleotidase, lipoprotein e(P4) family [Actinobacteria bacterium]|nr:5'-nucleotidase, lipoprotein e(P4) family [Actinomycetota bacterium]MBU1942496.1 5'-nucleotidase, lipoprotein e(P4) family [Actinomycetota bacterium]MBU2688803.1 5'-nucleotidase, lipoprotein e(P4) family [Actinomycetota bacterium]